MGAITADPSDHKRAMRLITLASVAFTAFVAGMGSILAVVA